MVNIFWERFYNLCISNNTKPNPVAKEIGISSGIITKWKNIGTLPNGETLIKLADYFNCSVDYLLGRMDTNKITIKEETILLFNKLDEGDQREVIGYIKGILNNEKYSQEAQKLA